MACTYRVVSWLIIFAGKGFRSMKGEGGGEIRSAQRKPLTVSTYRAGSFCCDIAHSCWLGVKHYLLSITTHPPPMTYTLE